jgi:pimeloyl-ACP methyl ester carboxylesterase
MGQPIARGLAERIARIPDSDSPIRIERYLLPGGQWHTEVFVAGTRTWDLEQTDDPFDMRSNLALVAGLPAAAAMATEKAMARAGVRRGDRVLFVGHSQGGAVAASLAESGRYDTRGLLTVGAPLGNQPVRGDYPAIRIEHRDDLVVDLGGYRQPGGQWVVETDSGADPGDVAGAHGRSQYLETATRIDGADLTELRQFDRDIPAVRGRVVEFDARQILSGDAAVGGKTVR